MSLCAKCEAAHVIDCHDIHLESTITLGIAIDMDDHAEILKMVLGLVWNLSSVIRAFHRIVYLIVQANLAKSRGQNNQKAHVHWHRRTYNKWLMIADDVQALNTPKFQSVDSHFHESETAVVRLENLFTNMNYNQNDCNKQVTWRGGMANLSLCLGRHGCSMQKVVLAFTSCLLPSNSYFIRKFHPLSYNKGLLHAWTVSVDDVFLTLFFLNQNPIPLYLLFFLISSKRRDSKQNHRLQDWKLRKNAYTTVVRNYMDWIQVLQLW